MNCAQKINPHQLDYDWQFDSVSQELLFRSISGLNEILLLGCPSLMVRFDVGERQGLLVERNPIHLPTKNFQIEYQDLRFYDQISASGSKYNLAIGCGQRPLGPVLQMSIQKSNQFWNK
jgi:hypothetical protein